MSRAPLAAPVPRWPLRTWLAASAIDLVYLILLVLVLPWLLFLVVVKKRGVGSLAERLGAVPLAPASGKHRIWLHAVSVGELEAALPVVRALEAQAQAVTSEGQPPLEIVISTTTTSAQQLARRRLPDHPVFLLPLDFGPCLRRALRRVRPTVMVLIELELWPNLLLHLTTAGLPTLIANGRISARGARRMGAVRWLLAPFLRMVRRTLVQDQEIADRLLRLGAPAERLRVVGNLKFDRDPLADPGSQRLRFEDDWHYGPGSRRWIGGCTHPGEEQQLLAVHRRLLGRWPDLGLILAPRHPERAPELARTVAELGFAVALDSEPRPAVPPQVVIVDRIGVLVEHYACADAAFVGGSLIPRGGHNVLEPFLAGTACLHGPHMANFRTMVELLTGGGASQQVADASELEVALAGWLEAPEICQARVDRGLRLLASHRGVALRTATEILRLLPIEKKPDVTGACQV